MRAPTLHAPGYADDFLLRAHTLALTTISSIKILPKQNPLILMDRRIGSVRISDLGHLLHGTEHEKSSSRLTHWRPASSNKMGEVNRKAGAHIGIAPEPSASSPYSALTTVPIFR